jgi:glutamate N-acetyltransferase / amino-acid N-acetyltransferase
VSVTGPQGFVASSAAAGLKAAGADDVALVATADSRPVPAAAVFTANLAPAASVQVNRRHLADTEGRSAAVLLTAGNANAATGRAGVAAAERLCAVVGEGIGVPPAAVLVCQTGLIGIPFPLPVVEAVLPGLIERRRGGPEASRAAAGAIMTTDTVPKEVSVAGDGFAVGGLAKGAAMLCPNMATMLAVLTTDALAGPAALRRVLRDAVATSFNSMTVDGCTSTNDTVILLASGRAGPAEPEALEAAVGEACRSLAEQMLADAEGATKVLAVCVRGALSDADAHRAARRVASSLLVKCSINGADPYWGRVVSELGTAGVDFDPDVVSISYGGVTVCRDGVAAAHDAPAVAAHMAGPRIDLVCDLGLGTATSTVLGTDLGHGYIDENRMTS